MKNKNKIIISIIVIVVVIVSTIFLCNKFWNKDGIANTAMTKLVTQYYEENIKGKVIGVNQQKVTLKALEDAGYDISPIIKNNNYDKTKSYSLVIIEDPKETDASKIVYRVENHLNGE